MTRLLGDAPRFRRAHARVAEVVEARPAAATLRAATRRPAVRRTAWAVADQGLASVTNFAVTVAIARSVDASGFGLFSLVFVVYALLLAVTRAVVSQPLAVRASARHIGGEEISAATGAAVLCGTVAGAAMVVVGLVVGGEAGTVTALVGVFMPVLLLQDVWRFVFFTVAKPKLALVNDLVWMVTQVALTTTVIVTGPSVVRLSAAWGASAVAAAMVGMWQARAVPGTAGLRYLRSHGDLGSRFGVEVAFEGGATQLAMLLLGAVVGARGVGAIRGSRALFGPFSTALVGLTSAAISEGSRLHARRPGDLRRALELMSATLATLGLACGLVLMGLPEPWGRALLGDTWPVALQVVPAITGLTIGAGLSSGAVVGLRVLAAAPTSMRLSIASGIVALAAAAVGGAVHGTTGSAWGLCLAAWVNAAGGWWLFGRLHRATQPDGDASG